LTKWPFFVILLNQFDPYGKESRGSFWRLHSMKTFVLHWIGGKTETVTGGDIADACRRAGIGAGALRVLDYFEEQGDKVEIAGKASCGCVYHAEEGLACPHDLEKVGLSANV
jgi:hypothetical protein